MNRDARRMMRRAIALARRGRGHVSPNPMVGAVVARDGRIVGEGIHYYRDRDHAEVIALKRAGKLARGADLFVNLEPCSHQGRTPPCTQTVLEAGIRRLYYGSSDPSPVAGGGGERLRQAGIEVHQGVLKTECDRLNEIFLHSVHCDHPFVLLKLGMSLDGRIAGPSRDSRWITGERARRRVHQLRNQYDAILVGIGTVLADDPSLDVRTRRPSPIHKVVLDTHLRTPVDARLFDSNDEVTLFHAPGVEPGQRYPDRTRTVPVAVKGGGLDWSGLLNALAGTGIKSLMIEGGGRVAASVLAAGAVDKIAFFYGPLIVGSEGVAGVEGLGIRRLSEARRWSDLRFRKLGDDYLVEAYPAQGLKT